ncbi:30S ribosomal protein S2 [Candidatus Woesebacteria bacterium]|nr:30S ribosomal protein S2 [Candidatus Woesebacteria bacterium]
MAVEVSLKELIQSGAHYGHQAKRWNPKMEEYIYGVQDGVHLFDLIKTKEALEEALAEITKYIKEGKKILLLGTKKQAKEKIEKVAKENGVYFVSERWLGGTFTNFDQMKKSLRKLSDMRTKMEQGEYKDRTKKERLLIEREIARLERFFGGISGMEAVPDMLIVIDIKREKAAIREATMKGITTVGIVDSNSDPTSVDYPIPMNDDATKALDYVIDLFGQAIEEGKGETSSSSKAGKKKTKKKTSRKKVRTSQSAKS